MTNRDFEILYKKICRSVHEKEMRAKYKKVICDYKEKVVVIKNQKQLDRFMKIGFGGN